MNVHRQWRWKGSGTEHTEPEITARNALSVLRLLLLPSALLPINHASASIPNHLLGASVPAHLLAAMVGVLALAAIPTAILWIVRPRRAPATAPLWAFVCLSFASSAAYGVEAYLLITNSTWTVWASVLAGLLTEITLVTLTVLILVAIHRNGPVRERLAALMESTQDAVIRENLDGKIIEWSSGATQIYGYLPDEVIGTFGVDLVPMKHRADAQETRRRVRLGETITNLVTEKRDKQGHEVPVSMSMSPTRDESGRIIGTTAVVRDLRPTRSVENRLQAVMSATPLGILLVDHSGVIQDANPGAARLFGYHDELIGMQIEALIPARLRDNHAHFRENYMMQPTPRSMGAGRDLRGLTREGKEIPVEIALTPLPNDGLAMATIIDITERKRLQEELERHARILEQSNEELDSFAYVASHDLKSPLRGVQNLCQFIEEDLDGHTTPELAGHLSLMRGRIIRMERLLDDLLTYSRVGRTEQHLTLTNVTQMITNIQSTLSIPDGFTVHVAENIPTIDTYGTPLEQVFRNLIHNAIKHHDRKDGHIWISSEPLESAGLINFCVEDDGPGIEPRFNERIFQMFTTLSPRDEVEGSGVGLALVKKLVERYGGSVSICTSQRNRGARFEFTWPKHMAVEQE